MTTHSDNARGSRKKSGKGEKNIREWEDQYPGRWILLQVTEEINYQPVRGMLIATASDPEDIQNIWKSHRKKGVLTMLTYGPSPESGPAVVACAA
jgi:hypothetical protein